MSFRCSQDIYGFYKGGETPSIESYPVRLPSILSPTDLDPYKYEAITSDEGGEFRLIELLPPRRAQKDSQELLKCRLHKHVLSDAPEYQALSYCWGKIERHLTLSVVRTDEAGNQVEEALYATPQLMMALRRLRHPTSSKMLWIDQLCINQKNDEEKGIQIRLMGDIYRTACEVVIWLGEDPTIGDYSNGLKKVHLSEVLGDTLRLMSANGSDAEEDAHLAHTLFDAHPTYHRDSPQKIRLWMLTEILDRPWFTRAWVFQEASLGKQLSILYGGLEMRFEELKRLCDAVSQVERNTGIYRYRSLAMDNAGFEMIQCIQRTREQLRHDSTANNRAAPRTNVFLSRLLQVLRRVRCFDQRDLIYAFLALQNGEGIIASAESYQKSTEEVWRYAAECIIKSSKSLDIFAALSGDKPREMALPSWVPYWSDCFPYSRPIATPTTNFCTAKDTQHVWSVHTDPQKLRVKGKIIDEVFGGTFYRGPPYSSSFNKFLWDRQTPAHFIPIDLIVQWERCFYDEPVIKPAFAAHRDTKLENLRRDIMRIVLADGALGTVQPLRGLVDDMLKILDTSDYIRELRKSKRRDEMMPEEIQLMDQYETLENLVLVAEHKQLFRTKGFLQGMAPKGLKVGDKIAILHGSKVPCVLRASNEAENEYRVISQCYLDGWMFGEPRGDVPWPHPHLNWWEEEADEFILI